MKSRQMLDAQAVAQDDARAWQAHTRECIQCARSKHHRGARGYPPCERGRHLLDLIRWSGEAYARELAKDAEPDPAQGTLL